jgi:nucleoside triphosphate pyrophosphatase
VDESVLPRESAEHHVRRLAEAKACAVLSRADGRPVLGADTVVVVAGEILGKPADEGDARRMLRLLSGRSHEVMTGVCLLRYKGDRGKGEGGRGQDGGGRGQDRGGRGEDRGDWGRAIGHGELLAASEVAVTTVEFGSLTDAEIDWYVASGEPRDKAGAYAIQGLASRFVTRIDGSYSNVVGLPVGVVYRMCTQTGLLIS